MSEDRREFSRVPVRTVVRMTFQSIGEFMQSYAENISEGGMRLATREAMNEGDMVGLEFRLKSDYPLIEGSAEVKWCRAQGEHYLIGVQFEDLDERSRRVISEAVQMKLRTQGGDASPAADAEDLDIEAAAPVEPDVEDLDTEDLLAPPDAPPTDAAVPEEIDFSDVTEPEPADPGAEEDENVEEVEAVDAAPMEAEDVVEEAEAVDAGPEQLSMPSDEGTDTDLESVDWSELSSPEDDPAPADALFDDTALDADAQDGDGSGEVPPQMDFGGRGVARRIGRCGLLAGRGRVARIDRHRRCGRRRRFAADRTRPRRRCGQGPEC